MKEINSTLTEEEAAADYLYADYLESKLIEKLCNSLKQTIPEVSLAKKDDEQKLHRSHLMLVLGFWDFQEKNSITLEGKSFLEEAVVLDPSFDLAKYAIEMINSKGEPLIFKDKLEVFAKKLPQAQFDLGEIHYENKNMKEALKFYNAAAKSDYLYAQERLGDIAFKSGNYKNAAKWYSKAAMRSEKTECTASYKLANSYFLAYSANQVISKNAKRSNLEGAKKRYRDIAKSEFCDRSAKFKSALILLTLYFEKEINLPADEIKCFFDVVAEYVLSDFLDGKVSEVLDYQYENLEIDVKKTGRSLIVIRQWIYFQKMLNQQELSEQDIKIKKMISEIIKEFKEKNKSDSVYYRVAKGPLPPKKIVEIFDSLLYNQQSQRGSVEFKWEALLGKIANIWDNSDCKEISKFIGRDPDNFAYAWILQNFRHLIAHYKNKIEKDFPGYEFLAFIILVFKKATFNCAMDSEIDKQLFCMIGSLDESINLSSIEIEEKVRKNHLFILKEMEFIEKNISKKIEKIKSIKHPDDPINNSNPSVTYGWSYDIVANYVASYQYRYKDDAIFKGKQNFPPLNYFYGYIFSLIIFGKQKNRVCFEKPISSINFFDYLNTKSDNERKFLANLAGRTFSRISF